MPLTKEQVLKNIKKELDREKDDSWFCPYCYQVLAEQDDKLFCSNKECGNTEVYNLTGLSV